MTTIANRILINAPKDKVWAALADFGNVHKMSPNINASNLTSDLKQGIGATRHCDLAMMGAQVEERIIAWEEGKSMTIHIYETKKMPMVTELFATFSVEEQGEKTMLTGSFKYKMTNIIGDLMNLMMMKKMNSRAWEIFLAGIKHHIETGKEVKKGMQLDLSAVQTA